MPRSRVAFEIANGLAKITFINPARHHAIDLPFCEELADATIRCAAEANLKAVLISAIGEVFCVGGDIGDFVANRERIHPHILAMASLFHVAASRLYGLAAPVITAVNGMAAGGGFSMVCASDMAIAKRSAKLNPAYTRTGLTPDGGGTYFLPRIVGFRKAFEIFATNPTLSAEEACALGIVSRVVEDEKFEAEVDGLMRQIEEAPSSVLGALKRLIRRSESARLHDQLDAEADSIAAQAAMPATQEKLAAFLARSKPKGAVR
jgi:2-(1,2-epoxy-1,2-dihydrophenyl)acetyl-CoA isomerase